MFLALIGIFSGYLTVVGLRFAKNRKGLVGPVDYAIHGVMAVASLGMIVLGGRTLAGDGVVLLVFGLIGLFLPLAIVWSRRVRAGRPATLDRPATRTSVAADG